MSSFLSSLLGGGGSSSSSSSTTTATDARVTTGGDQTAPIQAGSARSQQANGDGSLAAGRDVKISTSSEDNRNFGTSLDGLKIGNGSTLNVTTADPALAAAAIGASGETARLAMLSNLATVDAALTQNQETSARAFDFGSVALAANADTNRAALEFGSDALAQNTETSRVALAANSKTISDALTALAEVDRRRDQATTQAINAGLDLGRQASASAEAVQQNALNKLAEQRAPDGANLTKIALAAIVALFGYILFRSLRSSKPRE